MIHVTNSILDGVAGPAGPQGIPGPQGADSTVPGPKGDTGATGPTPVIPITSKIYVDFLRADSYTAVGSREFPYKTLAAAYTTASSIGSSSNPITIVLLSSNLTPENITFSKGHIFLTAENSSGTHAPLLFTGSLVFQGPNTSISENHFAVSNIELIGVSGTDVVTFSGSYPQRLFLKDVWITVNGSAHGVTMTNTGGSSVHLDDCKFTHNGSGNYYCVNVTKGTANIDNIETSSVSTGVISATGGGTANIINSDLTSAGTNLAEVYANSAISFANVKITTTSPNSTGINLKQAGSVTLAGLVTFNVPAAGTGRAIDGVAGSVLYYGPMFFLPDGIGGTTNTKVNPLITALPISTTMTRA
jgi:hypothetical protein